MNKKKEEKRDCVGNGGVFQGSPSFQSRGENTDRTLSSQQWPCVSSRIAICCIYTAELTFSSAGTYRYSCAGRNMRRDWMNILYSMRRIFAWQTAPFAYTCRIYTLRRAHRGSSSLLSPFVFYAMLYYSPPALAHVLQYVSQSSGRELKRSQMRHSTFGFLTVFGATEEK